MDTAPVPITDPTPILPTSTVNQGAVTSTASVPSATTDALAGLERDRARAELAATERRRQNAAYIHRNMTLEQFKNLRDVTRSQSHPISTTSTVDPRPSGLTFNPVPSQPTTQDEVPTPGIPFLSSQFLPRPMPSTADPVRDREIERLGKEIARQQKLWAELTRDLPTKHDPIPELASLPAHSSIPPTEFMLPSNSYLTYGPYVPPITGTQQSSSSRPISENIPLPTSQNPLSTFPTQPQRPVVPMPPTVPVHAVSTGIIPPIQTVPADTSIPIATIQATGPSTPRSATRVHYIHSRELRPYDGYDPAEAQLFLDRYERFTANWGDREIVESLANYCDGNAAVWISGLISELRRDVKFDKNGLQTDGWAQLTWDELKQKFNKAFGAEDENGIYGRSQKPNESGLTFFLDMKSRLLRCTFQMSTKQQILHIVRNMQPQYQRVLRKKNISTLDQLQKFVRQQDLDRQEDLVNLRKRRSNKEEVDINLLDTDTCDVEICAAEIEQKNKHVLVPTRENTAQQITDQISLPLKTLMGELSGLVEKLSKANQLARPSTAMRGNTRIREAPKCFYCSKFGHVSKNCRTRLNAEHRQEYSNGRAPPLPPKPSSSSIPPNSMPTHQAGNSMDQ